MIPKYIEDFQQEMKQRHALRKSEQKTDESFLRNDYPLPLIKKKEYQMRTNFAVRMVNAITQQVISNLPKVYTYPNKDTESSKKSCADIAIVLNRWIYNLLKQTSSPFDQTFKNFCYRGDAWLYLPHNRNLLDYGQEWGEYYPDALPTQFLLYDPTIVYSEPNEELDGEPKRVLIEYDQNISFIKDAYPLWSNPMGRNQGKTNNKAKFLFYFDKEKSFAQADNEPLFRVKTGKKKGELLNDTGERTNPYGCVPFVHLYSGWGFEEESRDPSMLAYSRIRMIRDLITEDSQVRSDFLYNFYSFAHKSLTLFVPAGTQVAPEWASAFKNDPDKLNKIELPEGADPTWFKASESQLFDAQAFAYGAQVRADLGSEYPAPLRGAGGTSSGREADILGGNALALYDCAIENTASLWAKGLMKALKVASSVDLLPKGISEDDLTKVGEISINLKPDDPVENARKTAEGQMLYERGVIDLEELYIKYLNKTQEEARKLKARVWIEQAMRTNPVFQQLIIQTAAEEMGKEEELAQIQAQTKEAAQGLNPTPNYGSKGGEPRQGNIKTPAGREMADESAYHETRVSRGA